MVKILLIDDEIRMLELLALYLTPHHFQCTTALGASEGLDSIAQQSFDIILLDIMMPDMDGFEVCRRIRQLTDTPIIMVTARDQKEDIVKGLQLGADDYITKPFDEEEMIARIRALLRRSHQSTAIEVAGLRWNEEQFEVTYQQHPLKLTPKEFALLGLFMKNPERVFKREQLIDLIWGHDALTEGRTVDSHIKNMREKIRAAGFKVDDYFTTVWGVGYKWKK